MMVLLLSREGRSQTAIASILGMDARTVKAILSRQDRIVADGRMLLKANTLGFVGDAILASQEAAKRGKIEGISAMLDRLGVTEPPKSGTSTQVAVQVNLHGGPEPVSLAKVQQDSEATHIQAGNDVGLIMGLTLGDATPQVAENATTYSEQVTTPVMGAATALPPVSEQDTPKKQARKCESPRAGSTRKAR
jgi:hypothetical protein